MDLGYQIAIIQLLAAYVKFWIASVRLESAEPLCACKP